MIIPSMTPVEVLRQARVDLRAVENKMQRAKELLARRHCKGDRKAVLVEIHDYVSPSRNTWMVVLRYCKAGIQSFHYCWYRGMDQRMRALYLNASNGTAFHFSKHIFDRYSERFSPDVKGEERLRQFFLANHMYSAHTVDLMADEVEDVISVDQGWLLGKRDEEEPLTYLATFVDQGHFFVEQHELEQRLEFERLLACMSTGQRAALIKEMKGTDAPDLDQRAAV